MQHSSISWTNANTNTKASKYYNPVSKIRSLIKNLDAELMQLCNQCTMPSKPLLVDSAAMGALVGGGGSNNSSSRQNQSHNNSSGMSNTNRSNSGNGGGFPRFSPNSMLVVNASEGIQARTLSGIYRAKVIDAYRNRRIFTVYGNYHTIRRALLRRGWLEKLAPGRYPKLQGLSEEVLLQHAKRGNEFEAMAISKIINHFPSFFIWQSKAQRDLFADVLPHRNRVRRARNIDFATKVGLIGCAELEHWYRKDDICGMSYPRFYRLGGSFEERISFIDDFRFSQCRCLLRFVAENAQDLGWLMDDEVGSVSPKIISYALNRVSQHMGEWEHTEIDKTSGSNTDSDSLEWQHFMTNSNLILRRHGQFKSTMAEMSGLAAQAHLVIAKLDEMRPDYRWDGYRNLWILKPGYSCRGLGIIIRNSLDEILQWATNNPNRRYIAQKYVERPLLVYNTKFDIRQYMLLCIGESTVTVWLYKDCYLRFSSQEFNLDDMRESIHLTNNSVQKRYKNKANRDVRLPQNNMWSLEQFRIFLKHHDAPSDVWDNKVFVGFRENLIAVVQASLEDTDFVENAFELYGCDFMLDEHYNPILIEINATPDLSPSTAVTARICPNALKDLVKVVVDLPRNSRATTGLFEQVYEVNYRIKKDFDPNVGLDVSGKTCTLHKHEPKSTSPRRSTVLKKSTGVMKKAEVILKTPLKRLKKNAHTKSHHDLLAIETLAADEKNGKPLKSNTKEALALRYTLLK